MRAHHPIRATHRVANSPRALVIQMILQQQPQQFAPIGFQIGLDVTVRLVADHLGAQMVRDRDQLLIGAMKRLVKRDNLCFHRFGPLVAGVERIKCFIYPLRGLVSSIIRYNILISFNSVSLRKSHTQNDVARLSSSTPLVVFTHIPLWAVYPAWEWVTEDGEQALGMLKRFGSVTVLNGHIHQILQKVEGQVTFHTALSTVYPQPAP